MNLWQNKLHSQKGAFVILLAILLPLIMAITGFTVDFGNIYAHKARLQNAADSAALAGGNVYAKDKNKTTADTTATNYWQANDKGDITMDGNTVPKENYYRVTLTEKVPLYFLRIFQLENATITAAAQVKLSTTGSDLYSDLIEAGSLGSGVLNFVQARNKIFDGTVRLNTQTQGYSSENNETLKNDLGATKVIIDSEMDLITKYADDYASKLAQASKHTIGQNDGQNFDTSSVIAEAINPAMMSSLSVTSMKYNTEMFILGNNGSGKADVHMNSNNDMKANNQKIIIMCLSGDVHLDLSQGSTFRGIIYCPNGQIQLNANGGTFYGSLVAKSVDIQGGSGDFHSDNNGGSSKTTTTKVSLVPLDE